MLISRPYVFISANYAAFLIAKNAAPLLPFLLHSKLPKVVYSDLPITGYTVLILLQTYNGNSFNNFF